MLPGSSWKAAFLVSGNPFDLRAGIHPLIIGRGFLKSKHMNIPSKGFSKYFWLGKYPPIHWNNRSCKCNHISKILRKKQTQNSGFSRVFFQPCHGSFTWWCLSLTFFREELSNLTYLDHLLRLGRSPSRNKSRLDLFMGPDLFLVCLKKSKRRLYRS